MRRRTSRWRASQAPDDRTGVPAPSSYRNRRARWRAERARGRPARPPSTHLAQQWAPARQMRVQPWRRVGFLVLWLLLSRCGSEGGDVPSARVAVDRLNDVSQSTRAHGKKGNPETLRVP
eukprot:1196427-Prorocentrum_minimum.AAC.7